MLDTGDWMKVQPKFMIQYPENSLRLAEGEYLLWPKDVTFTERLFRV